MEHDLELIIARLEILEIEVCNISYKPRDIGNLSFSTSSYSGNIGNLSFRRQAMLAKQQTTAWLEHPTHLFERGD